MALIWLIYIFIDYYDIYIINQFILIVVEYIMYYIILCGLYKSINHELNKMLIETYHGQIILFAIVYIIVVLGFYYFFFCIVLLVIFTDFVTMIYYRFDTLCLFGIIFYSLILLEISRKKRYKFVWCDHVKEQNNNIQYINNQFVTIQNQQNTIY